MPSLAQLEKMLSADPRDPFILYAIAQEHAKAADHAQALTFYDRCLAADPVYSYAYYHKARSLEALGRPADAIAVLRAGENAARNCGDDHALSEISAYLDALSP